MTILRSILRAIFALALVGSASASSAADDPKWLCVPDATTGFNFENGKWRIARFDTAALRFLVAKRAGEANYSVQQIGELGAIDCKTKSPDKDGWLVCELPMHWRINVFTLRYVRTYAQGYANGRDDNGDTPFVEIGKCSPL